MPQINLSIEDFTKQYWNKDYNSLKNNKYFNSLAQKAYAEYKRGENNANVANQVQDRYSEVTDFNSDYYKQYSQFLQKNTPSIGTDSLLGLLSAGGYDYGGAQAIASQRSKQLNQNRNEDIQKSTMEFALNSQNQGNSLLGSMLQNTQFNSQLYQQQQQFNANQPTFWDSLLNVAGGIAGTLTGNWLSPKVNSEPKYNNATGTYY